MNYITCQTCGNNIDSTNMECKSCHTKFKECPICKGNGFIFADADIFDCPDCNGQGVVKE